MYKASYTSLGVGKPEGLDWGFLTIFRQEGGEKAYRLSNLPTNVGYILLTFINIL